MDGGADDGVDDGVDDGGLVDTVVKSGPWTGLWIAECGWDAQSTLTGDDAVDGGAMVTGAAIAPDLEVGGLRNECRRGPSDANFFALVGDMGSGKVGRRMLLRVGVGVGVNVGGKSLRKEESVKASAGLGIRSVDVEMEWRRRLKVRVPELA